MVTDLGSRQRWHGRHTIVTLYILPSQAKGVVLEARLQVSVSDIGMVGLVLLLLAAGTESLVSVTRSVRRGAAQRAGLVEAEVNQRGETRLGRASFDALGGEQILGRVALRCGSKAGVAMIMRQRARCAEEARSMYAAVAKFRTLQPETAPGLDARLDWDGCSVRGASLVMQALAQLFEWLASRGWPFDAELLERAYDSEIAAAFDEEGVLRSAASQQLARARLLLARAEEELRSEVLKFPYGELFELERNVHVVAVARGEASQPFALSRSGKTAYVEPKPVAAARRRVQNALQEVDEAEHEVLERLSERLARRKAALRRCVNAAAEVDATRARCSIDGVVPAVQGDGVVDVRGARHPLLTASEQLDFYADSTTCTILCGPNGGGKSTLLSTVGLFALMVHCAIPIPAADGSRCDFFDMIAADIDGASRHAFPRASTFEAHCRFASHCLSSPATRQLVLLDELGSGTDADEGGAIAQAALEVFLMKRSATVLAATHNPRLKLLPASSPAYSLWTFSLDQNGKPTFIARRALTPENGGALHAAKRCGLPRAVLDRANSILDDSTPGRSEQDDHVTTRLQDLLRSELSAARADRLALDDERASWRTTIRQAAQAAKCRALDAATRIEEREQHLESLFQDIKSRPKLQPIEIVGKSIKQAKLAAKANLSDKRQALLAANGLVPLTAFPNPGDSLVLLGFNAQVDQLTTTPVVVIAGDDEVAVNNTVAVTLGPDIDLTVPMDDLATWSIPTVTSDDHGAFGAAFLRLYKAGSRKGRRRRR